MNLLWIAKVNLYLIPLQVPVTQIWVFPRVKKSGQGHTDDNSECWVVVSFLHMNELVFLYPKHSHMMTSSDFSIQGTNGTLSDPCFHPGYTTVMNVSDLYEGPCTKRFEMTLPFQQFQIQGTGNFQRCQESILQLFNTSYCPYSRCSFNGIFLPPLQGDFGVSLWNDKVYWLGWFWLQVIEYVPTNGLNNRINFSLIW